MAQRWDLQADTEANIQDSRGGKLLLAPLKGVFGRLKLIWAESS
jgi:hypothetical protein